MVFKKDLTPIGGKRGTVVKHNGKGSAERRPQLMPQLTGRYPKQTAPAPVGPMLRPMGSPPEDV
jgi:hypothetical protein